MKKQLGRILGVLVMLLVMGMTVCASDAEDIKINKIFQLNSDVELHEQPDTASEVTASLPGGTTVIVKEDAKDGWCKVAYQENAGYVEISFLGLIGSQSAPAVSEHQGTTENETASGIVGNVSALDEEFKTMKEEGRLAYQEAEDAKEQAKAEKKWGVVIAVLVIAIFAVGIISTLRNKGNKK
ncbi:MAG: SH3 domain-containing protein [Lachnospiraceae bacterium]|nr:SH3 domain-containing protein [Lachnospiraceae bacterium]